MIGIIHVGNVFKEPYFDKYKSVLEKSGVEYEVIIWDRKGELKNVHPSVHIFSKKVKSKLSKIFGFLAYFRFVQKTLKAKKYDKLILLTTLSAFACKKMLHREYKGKYIFDIRDLTYEYRQSFCKEVGRIIKDSAFSVISSEGFKKYLPSGNYVRSHNFRYDEIESRKKSAQLNLSDKINVVYIGLTRGDSFNKRLVEIFGGDERFSLRIAGEGCDSVAVLESANRYDNVTVSGRYELDQKADVLKDADILINMNLNSFNGKRLISNKYYDALILKIPQIARKGELMGEIVESKGLGISLDFEDKSFADKVYNYIINLDLNALDKAIESEIDLVLTEDEKYINEIKSFLNG